MSADSPIDTPVLGSTRKGTRAPGATSASSALSAPCQQHQPAGLRPRPWALAEAATRPFELSPVAESRVGPGAASVSSSAHSKPPLHITRAPACRPRLACGSMLRQLP